MPAKSRHGKWKHTSDSRRRISKSARPEMPAQRTAVASTHTSTPSASSLSSVAKPAAVSYPYIFTELRTIGILTVVMIAILVALALILR